MIENAQFYAMYLHRNNDVSNDVIEDKLDGLLSWYRVTDRFWILYTTKNAEKLYARMRPLIFESGSLFICKLDVSDRQGWMNKSFWNWLRGFDTE